MGLRQSGDGSDGILYGEGGSRPNEQRVYIPFPDGATRIEVYAIACHVFDVISAPLQDLADSCLEGLDEVMEQELRLDTIDGRIYSRCRGDLPLNLAQALLMSHREAYSSVLGCTRDLLVKALNTTSRYPDGTPSGVAFRDALRSLKDSDMHTCLP